ncbi:periplasmic binding protein-like I [Obelidium mucronatum]|nr:periplasmic binding protein-like I [Obelidium mucronatum]
MQTSLNMIGKRAWYTYYSDLAALVAIDMINNSSEILPGVTVNVKRFTDCGPWKPNVDVWFKGQTGGFASTTMIQDIIENHPDVIGVIGFQVSSTARGTGQVLSHYKIPYCTGCSTSPRLSNKNLFPYLWRPLPGLGLGNHIYQVLRN